MNKAQLIDVVADNLEVSRRVAGEAVDAVLAGITGAVIDGERVSLTGFGTFETAHRPARTARNPRTGESVRVSAATVPKFRAGQAFKDEVNGTKPKPGAKKAAAKKTVKAAVAKKAVKAATEKRVASAAAKKAAVETPAKKASAAKSTAKTAGKATAKKAAVRPVTKAAAKAPATKKTAAKATAKKSTAKKR